MHVCEERNVVFAVKVDVLATLRGSWDGTSVQGVWAHVTLKSSHPHSPLHEKRCVSGMDRGFYGHDRIHIPPPESHPSLEFYDTTSITTGLAIEAYG